jgi:hypothetical protein
LFSKLHAANLRSFMTQSPTLSDVITQPLWKNYFELCSSWNIDLTFAQDKEIGKELAEKGRGEGEEGEKEREEKEGGEGGEHCEMSLILLER